MDKFSGTVRDREVGVDLDSSRLGLPPTPPSGEATVKGHRKGRDKWLCQIGRHQHHLGFDSVLAASGGLCLHIEKESNLQSHNDIIFSGFAVDETKRVLAGLLRWLFMRSTQFVPGSKLKCCRRHF